MNLKKLTKSILFLSMGFMAACTRISSTCIDPAKVNPEAICTMQYDPVCGCDGKTYSNACVATHAGVTSFEKRVCAGSGEKK